jgi:outer membrane beta-barrel protein
MMKKTIAMRKVIALLLGAIVSLPVVAKAEKERKSPLTDAPVIRRRLELRDKRFEAGVGAAVTIGQDFYNALLLGPKLAFHFNDWMSLAASFGYNVTPGWKTEFNNDISDRLDVTETPRPFKPAKADAVATMNHIAWEAMAQLEFIPLSGKIAILSTLFSYFDFYILAGAGVVNLATKYAQPGNCQRLDANGAVDTSKPPVCKAVTGTKFAVNVGVGAHAFLTRWLALNFELHDLIYKNNASGRTITSSPDTEDNRQVTDPNTDIEWTNNFVFSLNFQFFLPAKAKVSR